MSRHLISCLKQDVGSFPIGAKRETATSLVLPLQVSDRVGKHHSAMFHVRDTATSFWI